MHINGMKGCCFLICLHPLCLVFAICSSDQLEGDMTVIMISGPWFFKNHLLLLEVFQPDTVYEMD